ncbi:hypothetical protein DDD64_06720 [Actinotignum sanguinis]|nr:hypothetical protein DDD64_06720 [Actinotignum sanguinis]
MDLELAGIFSIIPRLRANACPREAPRDVRHLYTQNPARSGREAQPNGVMRSLLPTLAKVARVVLMRI